MEGIPLKANIYACSLLFALYKITSGLSLMSSFIFRFDCAYTVFDDSSNSGAIFFNAVSDMISLKESLYPTICGAEP